MIASREEKLLQSEQKFGQEVKETTRQIEGLLSTFKSKYDLFSNLVNKTTDSTIRTVSSSTSRVQQMTSHVNLAVSKSVEESKVFNSDENDKDTLWKEEIVEKLERSASKNKI